MLFANKRTDTYLGIETSLKPLSATPSTASLTTIASSGSLSPISPTCEVLTLQQLAEGSTGQDSKKRINDFCEFGKKLCRDQHTKQADIQMQNLQRTPVERLEASGLCMRKMTTNFVEQQKFGHSTLTFTVMPSGELPKFLRRDPRKALPPNKVLFKHGSEIGLFSSKPNGEILTEEFILKGVMVGVVSNKCEVNIMFDSLEVPKLKMRVDKEGNVVECPIVWDLYQLCNDITLLREVGSMDAIKTLAKSGNDPLLELAFGSNFNFYRSRTLEDLPTAEKTKLNSIQRDVVAKAIDDSAPTISLIQGPPGTGKTSTAAEIIYQLVQLNKTILVSAPSNLAVDNVLEKCLALGIKGVARLGSQAKLLPSVADYHLESLMEKTSCGAHLVTARKRLVTLWKAKKRNMTEILRVKNTLMIFEKKARKEVATKVGVIFATCCSAGSLLAQDFIEDLFEHRYGTKSKNAVVDVTIVDEAGQAIEPITWVPILKAKRSVLLGDHQQLPPTVICEDAKNSGLGVSLFERLIDKYTKFESKKKVANCIAKEKLIPVALGMLTVQYRMNTAIMNWSSGQFYHNQLIADPSVADRILSTANLKKGFIIPNKYKIVKPNVLRGLLSIPMIWIDTAGNNLYKELHPAASKGGMCNPGEAFGVCGLISELFSVALGKSKSPVVSHSDLGVITPYRGQLGAIKNSLVFIMGEDRAEEVNVNTVDSFQGRENEVILLSLVRSNPQDNIGFLSECRRLNVAITRAKRLVVVVGDSKTVSSCQEIKNLFEKFKQLGRVIRAEDVFDEKLIKSLI